MVVFGVTGVAIADDLADRFWAEAPLAWQEYAKHDFHVSGTAVQTWRSGGAVTFSGKTRFGRYNSRKMSVNESIDSEEGVHKEAYVANSKYAFTATGSRSGGEWVVTDFTGDLERLPANYSTGLWHGPHHSLLGMQEAYLPEFVKLPAFKVRSVQAKLKDGKNLVEVHFTCDSPDNGRGGYNPVRSGSFVLDPEKSWSLAGYAMEMVHSNAKSVLKSTSLTTDIYRNTRFPLLTGCSHNKVSISTEEKANGIPLVIEFNCTINYDSPPLSEESDFSLSAFGLPEPPGVTWERPTPRYVWLLAAAAVLAVVALVLRRLGRRRPRPSVGATP